jgi:hypothetical protein
MNYSQNYHSVCTLVYVGQIGNYFYKITAEKKRFYTSHVHLTAKNHACARTIGEIQYGYL